MLIWLDWFCRYTSDLLPEKLRHGDPRTNLAMWTADWLQAAKRGKIAKINLLEETFYVLLALFTTPYLPAGSTVLFEDQPPANPLGLVLTRATAGLLADANLPNSVDAQWSQTFGDNRAIYVDVPHGALLVELAPGDVVELRAIFAGTLRNATPFAETFMTFVGLLTDRGSERGRGRFLGTIAPDGRVRAMASTSSPRLTMADSDLKAPFVDPGAETRARERTGQFLRLVLAYYAFGPEEAREKLKTTETGRLIQGKPRKGENFFAMTRLNPAHDRLGRPATTELSSWSLTSRQDVTGHFKLQPHGPAMSLRKLIWVEGYIRGPVEAPVRPRAYHV